jgi:hypothetical protein
MEERYIFRPHAATMMTAVLESLFSLICFFTLYFQTGTFLAVGLGPLITATMFCLAYIIGRGNKTAGLVFSLVGIFVDFGLVIYHCSEVLLILNSFTSNVSELSDQAVYSSTMNTLGMVNYILGLISILPLAICSIILLAQKGKNLALKKAVDVLAIVVFAFFTILLVLYFISIFSLNSSVKIYWQSGLGFSLCALGDILVVLFSDLSLNKEVIEEKAKLYPYMKEEAPTLSEEEKIRLLRSYQDLLDKGIITKEEFEKKKGELLK